MVKTVCKNPEIILAGFDVSHLFKAANISLRYGELNLVYLTLYYDPDFIEIEQNDASVHKDRIRVFGEDISNWVSEYQLVNSCTDGRTIELTIHADENILSINGTHPWVGTNPVQPR